MEELLVNFDFFKKTVVVEEGQNLSKVLEELSFMSKMKDKFYESQSSFVFHEQEEGQIL